MKRKPIASALFALLLLLPFFGTPTHAQGIFNGKPNPDGTYGYDESIPDLLNTVGLAYHKARPIIMAASWSPFQTLQKGTDDYEFNALWSGKNILGQGISRS